MEKNRDRRNASGGKATNIMQKLWNRKRQYRSIDSPRHTGLCAVRKIGRDKGDRYKDAKLRKE